MPIATSKMFSCLKCGYKTVKTIGEVIKPTDFICPKCREYMEMDDSSETKYTLFDVLKALFTKK